MVCRISMIMAWMADLSRIYTISRLCTKYVHPTLYSTAVPVRMPGGMIVHTA